MGVDKINKQFMKSLMKVNLPSKLPNSPFKLVTMLNTDDVVAKQAKPMAGGKLEKSLKKLNHVIYVNDRNGTARKKWNLKKKHSAVIIFDVNGKVIYFREGKMNESEILKAIIRIKKKIKM